MRRNKSNNEYSSIYNSTQNCDDGYEDNYEATLVLLGYEPPMCPRCKRAIMKFHFEKRLFKCFSCGYSFYEEDLEDELDSHDDYSDIYRDGKSDTPTCELCGSEMQYSKTRHKFKCPRCATTMEEDEWSSIIDSEEDYDIYYDRSPSKRKPECCESCGGPFPKCADGCRLINKE